ncbi:hypothetical protein HEQ62_03305 [Haematospirillum jordaniae]|nr:hypothetical protein [Haematospirillum jordaniae]NKD44841.1 hypothetical protein [Haematospirillum jordaniae]NKD57032.1 hypothetical protein [Haematospirillum jordaniae]NKD58812.1 hypothetical protein [Haematospirillum jordaniae]NKD78814.1 hypothetical protein [Haematospirillum jordaniae]NKD83442.1 hypothetical protein [Haematospirillum jordaniae]
MSIHLNHLPATITARNSDAGLRYLERCLMLFKTIDPDIPLNSVIVFVQACLGHTKDVCFRDLARQLRTSTPTIGRQVAVLAESAGGLGLVRTKPDQDDARRRIILLSPKGETIREQLVDRHGRLHG